MPPGRPDGIAEGQASVQRAAGVQTQASPQLHSGPQAQPGFEQACAGAETSRSCAALVLVSAWFDITTSFGSWLVMSMV